MRVLIIDDDQLSAEMTAECLMMYDSVSVKIAGDGASALRLVREFAPELIFLDVHLPDASGVALAPQLKAESSSPAVQIVILSGTAHRDSTEYPEGIDAWLDKPVKIDTLLAFVSRKAKPE